MQKAATIPRGMLRTWLPSFIRTVTVGFGIAPNLLTRGFLRKPWRSRAGTRSHAHLPPVGSSTPP